MAGFTPVNQSIIDKQRSPEAVSVNEPVTDKQRSVSVNEPVIDKQRPPEAVSVSEPVIDKQRSPEAVSVSEPVIDKQNISDGPVTLPVSDTPVSQPIVEKKKVSDVGAHEISFFVNIAPKDEEQDEEVPNGAPQEYDKGETEEKPLPKATKKRSSADKAGEKASPEAQDVSFTTPHHTNPYFFPQARSRANPPLDLTTVARRKDITHNTVRGKPFYNSSTEFMTATFPSFYPTPEQFRDPITYIESISEFGKKFGAVKIIPPKTWDLPFCLDTEMFWFKTKRLSFNNTSISQQIRYSFVSSLYYFHKMNHTPINKLPLIDKRPLDLYHLHQCVRLRGGFDLVCKKKLWAQIGRELGYSGKIMTSLSTSLKTAYARLLFPYDNYLSQHGADDIHNGTSIATFVSPEVEEINQDTNGNINVSIGTKRPHPDASISIDPSKIRKRLRLDNGTEITYGLTTQSPFPCISNGQKSLYRSRPYTGAASTPTDPALPPFDNWHRGLELVEHDDYSEEYREAPTYNLRQFQQKAECFKEKYLESADKQNLSDLEIEKEFWKLVTDPTLSVEVEEGYDIHSSTQGSPSPQIERNISNPEYVTDPWNLNCLPFNENSYCRYIAESVPYLVQPWVHVGMMFSSETWHFKDYFSYMINYHHFGESKTWYSVPERDFEKFQNLLVKLIGPEAIDTTPSLLLESDCMLSPEELKLHNIECYSADQRPGEFIITFPKSYTANFNHGFNLSESVNFLPTYDWLDYGMQCNELYRRYRKDPPFSIQRLLLNMSSNIANISTAQVLSPLMEKMYNDEISLRNQVQKKYPSLAVQEYDDRDEVNQDINQLESLYCSYTRDICFLSRIVHVLTDDVISLAKFIELDVDEDEISDYCMILRYSNDDFKAPCSQLTNRASLPTQWYDKLTKYMLAHPRPPLKGLKALVAEGERIPVSMISLVALKDFIEDAVHWQDEVQSILTRKSQIRRPSEKSAKIGARKQSTTSPEPEENPKDLQYLQKLLDEAHDLPFSTAEMGLLRERAQEVLDHQKLVNHLISDPNVDIKHYEEALDVGKNLNISIPETGLLFSIVSGKHWKEKANAIYSTHFSLEDLDDLISEGEKTGIDDTNPYMKELKERQEVGRALDGGIKEALSVASIGIDYLEQLSSTATDYSINRETSKSLQTALQKHANVVKQVGHIHLETKKPTIDERPTFKLVKKVIDEAKSLNTKPKIFLIEKDFRIAEDWIRRGKRIIGKGNAPMYIFGSHLSIIQLKTNQALSLLDKYEPNSRISDTTASATTTGTGEEYDNKVFCICRYEEAGMMVECDVCHEWFHARCLKIGRSKFKENESFICPVCDWKSGGVPRDGIRPVFEDLTFLLKQTENLPIRPDELETLRSIVDVCSKFRSFLKPFVARFPFQESDIDEIRFYLTKLEGSEVLLVDETNTLRQELHRLAPLFKTSPPMVGNSQEKVYSEDEVGGEKVKVEEVEEEEVRVEEVEEEKVEKVEEEKEKVEKEKVEVEEPEEDQDQVEITSQIPDSQDEISFIDKNLNHVADYTRDSSEIPDSQAQTSFIDKNLDVDDYGRDSSLVPDSQELNASFIDKNLDKDNEHSRDSSVIPDSQESNASFTAMDFDGIDDYTRDSEIADSQESNDRFIIEKDVFVKRDIGDISKMDEDSQENGKIEID